MLIVLALACTAQTPPRGSAREAAEATAPATTADSTRTTVEPAPVEPVPDGERGDALFDGSVVHLLEITIDDAGLAALVPTPREYVSADLVFDGTAVSGVGLRLKGGGSFQPIGDKPSFKIHTDEFVEGLELDGLDELAVNNMVLDKSGLHERTAYHAYQLAGLPAPRSAHTLVTVNGQPYGLYLLVEQTDGRFLDEWYEDDDGPLFEMFDVDFTADQVALFDHDGGPDDRTALFGLAEALADPEATVTEDCAVWLDVDRFVRYFAASAVIAQYDAYPYSVPGDDVVLYVDPSDGRIDFLPHGADETFTDDLRPVDYVFGLLAARCLDDVACEWSWQAAVWEAMSAMEEGDLAGFVDEVSAQTGDLLRDDDRAPWSDADVSAGYAEMRAFVDGRRAGLEDMPGLQ